MSTSAHVVGNGRNSFFATRFFIEGKGYLMGGNFQHDFLTPIQNLTVVDALHDFCLSSSRVWRGISLLWNQVNATLLQYDFKTKPTSIISLKGCNMVWFTTFETKDMRLKFNFNPPLLPDDLQSYIQLILKHAFNFQKYSKVEW